MDCPFHKVLPDPDRYDSFCSDDEKVLCEKTGEYVTTACRPYNKRKECGVPDWCPIKVNAVDNSIAGIVQQINKTHNDSLNKVIQNQGCLHNNCTQCHGTGRKKDGSFCVHMISCPCPKCSIRC